MDASLEILESKSAGEFRLSIPLDGIAYRNLRGGELKRLIVVVTVLVAVSSGCFTPSVRFLFGYGWRAPAVPEVDGYILDLESLGPNSTPADVRAVLGEPPFRFEQKFGSQLAHRAWRYPVRSISVVPLPAGAKAQTKVIPAVHLKIRLDVAGRVSGWGFFHPVTGARLEIRQSLPQAEALFGKLCSPPGRIELEAALRPRTAKHDVLARMRWFGNVSPAIEQAQYRGLPDEAGGMLIYYADHPSPLYVPPAYVVVIFPAESGRSTTWHFETLFDGCE